MLGKRTQPLIGKISELLVSGSRAAALLDTIGSPRSPFEMNLKSPNNKGQKSYDLGGVGLGIVVALDEKKESCCEVLPKHALNNRSRAITIEHTNKNGFENSEDYTFVTYHVPNKTITKVYYDAGEGLIQSKINTASVHRTIQKPTQTFFEFEDETSSFPTSDFLSSCHMCRKNLHGKDIYMYRGEKAFCSTECRSKQIMMDERKERCRSEASRSNKELSTSPYTRDQMFSTGILAL